MGYRTRHPAHDLAGEEGVVARAADASGVVARFAFEKVVAGAALEAIATARTDQKGHEGDANPSAKHWLLWAVRAIRKAARKKPR
jgi:hypothetical protein